MAWGARQRSGGGIQRCSTGDPTRRSSLADNAVGPRPDYPCHTERDWGQQTLILFSSYTGTGDTVPGHGNTSVDFVPATTGEPDGRGERPGSAAARERGRRCAPAATPNLRSLENLGRGNLALRAPAPFRPRGGSLPERNVAHTVRRQRQLLRVSTVIQVLRYRIEAVGRRPGCMCMLPVSTSLSCQERDSARRWGVCLP